MGVCCGYCVSYIRWIVWKSVLPVHVCIDHDHSWFIHLLTIPISQHKHTLQQAMTYLSSTFLSHLSHRLNIPHYTTITCTIPLLGPTSIVTLCCALSSLAIALLWCAYQASAWGWVAQDVMGVCLMVVVLRLVRLPDLQVASLLLGLAFCYDVFWYAFVCRCV